MTTLRDVGIKLVEGRRLNKSDAEVIANTEDLISVASLADDLRRRRHGNKTTFVRVQEISIRDILVGDIEILSSAGEVRIADTIADYDEALRAVKALVAVAGSVPVTGFALDALVEESGGHTRKLLDMLTGLKETGLSLVAEARTERLLTPESLEIMGEAGLKVGRLTVGDAVDHGGVDLLNKVADWGTAIEHVHAIAPLSRVLKSQPTTGYRDLRQVALARLLVDNIDLVQVDWNLYGPKLAQVSLMFGANDIDTVSPLGSDDLGRRRAPLEEITQNIHASALIPVQRNGRFEIFET